MTHVLVVGGGILGAATAHALAPGAQVTLIDAAMPGAGVSFRSGGMVRAFHADPALADLARRSLPTWQAFGAHVGGSCGFRRTGSLYIAPAARREQVAAEVARLSAHVDIALLEASDARRRFPGWAFADDELIVHEPDAGWCDVPAAVAAYVAASGAAVLRRRPVTALRVAGGRVVGVATADGDLDANVVVVATGLGSPALLAPLGLGGDLHAKAIQVVRLGDGDERAGFAHPCFLSLGTRSYGRSTGLGSSWVGVASEAALDGDAPLDEGDAEAAQMLAAGRVTALAGWDRTGGLRTGDLYTRGGIGTLNSPLPGLVLALGFGGTGFKVAPAVAADAAALVRQQLEALV